MHIGSKLRKFRDKKQLSQSEVAERLGVAQATYWNWENDQVHFKMEYLVQLADIFEVDPTELVNEGTVVKIVSNKENRDNSINAFEVRMDEKGLTERLIQTFEEAIKVLKELRSNNEVLSNKPQKGTDKRN